MSKFGSNGARLAAALVLSGAVAIGCSSESDGGTAGGGGTAGSGGVGGVGGTAGGGGVGGVGGTAGGGGSAGMGGTGGVVPPQLVIVANGRTVRLLDVATGSIEEVASAEIPAAGLLPNHQIFGAVQQAGQQRIYVGSSNDCSANQEWCWGNGRIDRFTFTSTEVTYDGLAYEMNNAAFVADGISCAEGTEVDTGYTGQEGDCAPGGLAFSPDGTRFYVDDDDLDVVEIFSVDPATGDLAFLAEDGSTDKHGLTAHPDGTYLYNATRIFDITGDMVVNVSTLGGGNATEVVPSGTGVATTDLLVTTDDTDGFAIYDLTDPIAPVEVDSVAYDANQVRSQAHNADFSRFVLVGRRAVRTVSFDGTTLALEDEALGMGAFALQNRDVAVTGDDGELAVVEMEAQLGEAHEVGEPDDLRFAAWRRGEYHAPASCSA